MNPFPYSDDNKRYHSYSYYLKHKYGCKVARVPLNGGFTCPNRDGKLSFGGCLFCSEDGSGEQIEFPEKSLEIQFNAGIEKLSKWKDAKYLAYLQSFSGTYGDINRLKAIYSKCLSLPNVCGLVIATRADCINSEICDLLAEFAQKTDITIELGLQTIHDKTNKLMNRCEYFSDFEKAVNLLNSVNIPVWTHLLNGLPYETHDMMLQSAKVIGQMNISGIKIHTLYFLKNTSFAEKYQHFALSKDEYIDIVCNQLEVLPDNIVIGRLTGDAPRGKLLAPLWTARKREVLNAIDKELLRRDSFQGKFAKL